MENDEVKIADLYKIAEKVVAKHNIYGVECLFRAAIIAALKLPYMNEESLHDLVRGVCRLVRKEDDNGQD